MKQEKKNKGGRPVKVWTDEFKAEVIKKMEDYTAKTQIPILAEFAYKNNFIREQLYEYPELTYAIKKMMLKKETSLEKLGLTRNNTMAIFSLKQLGWRDTQDVRHTFDEQKAKDKIAEIFLT